MPRFAPSFLLALCLVALTTMACTAFVLPTPSTKTSATRLHLWGGKKKAAETPAPAKGGKAAPPANKRATPMKYGQNTVVDKDQDVIVPATEYFAGKQDPIVPILFAGLFVPIFGILGWWLYGPQPEPVIPEDQSTTTSKMSYDAFVKDSSKSKSRKF